jgi:thiamine-phosphate pyrophosphorylase
MVSALERQRLARAADALNLRAPGLPALILMTDEKRLKDPVAAARALPMGAAIILRHTDAKARAVLAMRLKPVARAKRLFLLIAGDPDLAARIGADGLHLSELRAREAWHWRNAHPFWLITAAAHSLRALAAAGRCGADAALLAPVFPTRSHRDRASLTPSRARLMAAQARIPVYALGGVDARNAARLKGFAGVAAIGALSPAQSE